VNFCSGWEWGYWIGDVMTARAAWGTAPIEDEARRDALLPVAAVFDAAAHGSGCSDGCRAEDSAGGRVLSLLTRLIQAQYQLLIAGERPSGDSTELRNGHGLLEGWDTDAEIEASAAHLTKGSTPLTQPDRVPLPTLLPRNKQASYAAIQPLLSAMASNFSAFAAEWADLPFVAPGINNTLFSEVLDSLSITALRAKQVQSTYAAANYRSSQRSREQARQDLQEARTHIESAQRVAAQRVTAYRVPVARVAGWLPHDTNKESLVTAYQYGYLWTVHSLLYWWRDYGRVYHTLYGIFSNSSLRSHSPCYLNFNAPADIGLGKGILSIVANALESLFGKAFALDLLVDCASSPDQEIVLPRDL